VLVRGNLYSMDHAIRNLPDDSPVVEIGTLCGLSTNAMSCYMRKHGRKNRLFTCDAWTYERFIDEKAICEVPVEEYQRFVKSTYIRNAEMFSRHALPSTVEMLSDAFFAAWEEERTVTDVFARQVTLGGPISFAYIDGDHSYQQSRQDFRNCDRFLVRGGFILFDDSAVYSEWGVRRTAREAMNRKDYELVIKTPNYLLRKVG
jgi:predicted O-methyltransferase YrrM